MFDIEQKDMLFQIAYSFDDVLMVPKKSDIETRKEVDLSVDFANNKFKSPIMSSPMDTVTETEMASTIGNLGGLGIIHRYNSIDAQAEMVSKVCAQGTTPAAAIGVSEDFSPRASALLESGCRILCIDVAHGFHSTVERAIKTLKDKYGDGVSIIAGNVACPDAFTSLESWGADAIRVGIGGGSICSTRIQTGHGVPTFQSVYACGLRKKTALLIADGGIRSAGDMVKSIAAGADFVMMGSLLAGTKQSPGEVLTNLAGEKYKVYRGMASRQAQEDWRGRASSLEGISATVPYKGCVKYIIQDLLSNIRSGFSYSGARNQQELRERCTFIRQSSAAIRESNTHILEK